MARRKRGRHIAISTTGEQVRAFVPDVLPPSDPPIIVEGSLAAEVCATEQALARLDLVGEIVPSLDCFIEAFARKEAVVSWQIEAAGVLLETTGRNRDSVYGYQPYLDRLSAGTQRGEA